MRSVRKYSLNVTLALLMASVCFPGLSVRYATRNGSKLRLIIIGRSKCGGKDQGNAHMVLEVKNLDFN